jgi:phage-related protein
MFFFTLAIAFNKFPFLQENIRCLIVRSQCFYSQLDGNVQAKIEWTLNLIRVTQKVPVKFFSHMTSTKGLYEVRVEVGSNIFRIFSFFDKGNIVVLGNGFHKKTKRHQNKKLKKLLK